MIIRSLYSEPQIVSGVKRRDTALCEFARHDSKISEPQVRCASLEILSQASRQLLVAALRSRPLALSWRAVRWGMLSSTFDSMNLENVLSSLFDYLKTSIFKFKNHLFFREFAWK